MVLDLLAHRNDAAGDLVPRDRGLRAGDVVGHLAQGLCGEPLDDAALAGVLVELFQELEVGEAEADAFDPGQELVRPGAADFLGGVELELAGPDELDGVLGGGDGGGHICIL